MLMRPQDRLRLYELHPTDQRILHAFVGARPQTEVRLEDGFAGLARERGARWIGMVLIKPGERPFDELPEIFDAGTAGHPGRVAIDAAAAVMATALGWDAARTSAEVAAVEHFELLQELSRQLRPTGVRLGLEHAGQRLGLIPRLFEAGLDYVKLDAAMVAGVGTDEHRATFVRGTVTLLHGLSLQVYAEGVSDAADAKALWDCGIDGATGPWISAQM